LAVRDFNSESGDGQERCNDKGQAAKNYWY
jgi:hypothetical protein